MKISVAAIEAKGGPFVFRDVEIDEPRPDEVLVRVKPVLRIGNV